MITFTVLKEHLDEENRYVGPENLADFAGHLEIAEKLGFVVFGALKVAGYIWAKAGSGIKAGEGIKAGWGIKAGEGIEAGWGIKAGFSITCKASLRSGLRIFAGLCLWRLPKPEESRVECKRLESGQVAFGELVEAEPKETAED